MEYCLLLTYAVQTTIEKGSERFECNEDQLEKTTFISSMKQGKLNTPKNDINEATNISIAALACMKITSNHMNFKA